MPYSEPEDAGRSPTRVSEIVQTLADLSIEAQDGDFLGSEGELLERLEVSRPTFRQAVKIVESDRLLTVRKGQGGGIFASRPDAADVIRAPARYLRLQGATLSDIHQAAAPISAQAARLAAACVDEGLRGELRAYRDELAGIGSAETTPERLINDETRLARLVAAMSGNVAIQVFMEIGYTFGRTEQRVRLYQAPEDRIRARTLQIQLCDALLESDPDIAALMMQRRSEMLSQWLSMNKAD